MSGPPRCAPNGTSWPGNSPHSNPPRWNRPIRTCSTGSPPTPTALPAIAHVVGIYPPSPTGGWPTYYDTAWLTPGGEKAAHAAYGMRLRNRPPEPPAKPDRNGWLTYIEQLAAIGVTGVSLDIVSFAGDNWTRYLNLLAVAQEFNTRTGKRFLVVPDIDGTSGDVAAKTVALGHTAVATALKPYFGQSTTMYANGLPVIGSFRMEGYTPEWWAGLAAEMERQYGYPVALKGVFNSASLIPTYVAKLPNLQAAGPWSPGADPAVLAGTTVQAAAVKAAGRSWIAPS